MTPFPSQRFGPATDGAGGMSTCYPYYRPRRINRPERPDGQTLADFTTMKTKTTALRKERDEALGKAHDAEQRANTADERWRNELISAREARDKAEQAYEELIFSVQRKFPGETRHQTALRYIQEAERACVGGADACKDALPPAQTAARGGK